MSGSGSAPWVPDPIPGLFRRASDISLVKSALPVVPPPASSSFSRPRHGHHVGSPSLLHPDIEPGPPEPVTSALAPLSLPHPVVWIPSSDFRAPDSVPRVPDIGSAPLDDLQSSLPHLLGQPTSLGHSPASSTLHPPPSMPQVQTCVLSVFSDPDQVFHPPRPPQPPGSSVHSFSLLRIDQPPSSIRPCLFHLFWTSPSITQAMGSSYPLSS
ncbi:hypothetical protein K438DRAFT_1979591 [Mycena galopus ATCC 62051]|nr:hypothetical protein K438DRAFT_1979591 [Mycena galopus ATCC 62051]